MKTVEELLFHQYESNRLNPAIRIDGKSITYEELYSRALKVATTLISSGAINETVAIVGHRNFSTYIGILGILFAGCNYTPINPKNNQSRILDIIEDSKVRNYIGDYKSISLLKEHLSHDSSIIKSIITPLCSVKNKEGYKWVDKNDIDKTTSLKDPLNSPTSNLAYILYTSGSTGKPKGVQVTRDNLSSYIRGISKLWILLDGFKMSQFHDLSFDPSVADIFYTLCNKGTLCVVPEEEMMLPSDFIIRENLNIWSSVPSIGIFMSKMGVLSENNYPDLRIVRHAGEPFPKTLAESWKTAAPNASIENHYGPTEATIDVARHVYNSIDDNSIFNNNIIPIGQSFPDMEIRIIDDDFKEIKEKNKKGEIIFCGPQISNGYLNDKKKTDESFVKFQWDESNKLWYRSGDIGFVNNEGNIECAGRKDNQIKIAGRRIEIGEIEFVLSKFEITKTAVVVPLRDKNNIITSCTAFVLCEISKSEANEIRKQSREFLDSIFFPKRFFTLENFPLSPSGKTDRKNLEKLAKKLMEP